MHEADQAELHAQSVLEVALGIELDDIELGQDYVLDTSKDMLSRCEKLVASEPSAQVVVALVAGLRNSYHLKPVHRLLVEMTNQVVKSLHAAQDGRTSLLCAVDVLGQTFKYGVQPADLDLVLQMCSDPILTYEGDIEDVRGYWFDSLGKIRSDRSGELCRTIIDADLGIWRDLRLGSAIQALRRVWNETDPARVSRVAEEHPDSYIRKVAKRSLAQR